MRLPRPTLKSPKSPNNSGFYDLLGSALFHVKKDLNGAEAAFNKALSLDGKNSDALIRLAQVQAAKGDVDQAIATCQRAIASQPRAAEFYILLGELYQSKQDWRQAKSAFEKARELQPNDPIATRDLANVLLQSGGNLDDALVLAQTAQRSMPDSPDAADTLGWVYYQKGEYPLALTLFQQALKLQEKRNLPDSPRRSLPPRIGLPKDGTTCPRAPAPGACAEDRSQLQRRRRNKESSLPTPNRDQTNQAD